MKRSPRNTRHQVRRHTRHPHSGLLIVIPGQTVAGLAAAKSL